MIRSTKADPRIVDSNRFLFLQICLLLILVAASAGILYAQPDQSRIDSTRILGDGLSSYFTSATLLQRYETLNFDLHEVELKYPLNSYQSFLDRSLSNLKSNPFSVDLRESSYYVPVRVRDELNLIMNRPRDSAFLPVLGIAWIAYQLGSKYLEIQRINIIDHDELLRAYPALPVLFSLWQKYPQTARQLYHHAEIQNNMTFKQVQEKLNLLQQNNLIKSRFYSPDSIQYFPNLFKEGMISIINSTDGNPDVPENTKTILHSIRKSILDIK